MIPVLIPVLKIQYRQIPNTGIENKSVFCKPYFAVSIQENMKKHTIFEKSLRMVYNDPKVNVKYQMKNHSHRTEIVKMLLQHGADLEESSNLYQTPLLLAAENGFLDAARILIEKGAEVNVQDNKNFTPLHHALNLKNEEFIKYLIDNKASVNVRSVDHTYPIHMASKSGHTKIVKLLIEEGADVNVVNTENNKHYTPLCWAVMKGHLDIFEILLQSSAKVNLPDLEQNKPIHHAAAIGHFEMAKLLLNHGANINAMNEKHQRPISLAVANGFLEVTKLLIQNGADLNFNDKTGMDPLCIAISKGINIFRINTLIRRCIMLEKEFHEFAEFRWFPFKNIPHTIVDALIRNGANVDIKKTEKLTLFHIAMLVNAKMLPKLLTYSTMDINATSFNDETLLHFAVRLGLTKAIKTLIQHGASLNSKIDEKKTPLELVLKKKHPNNLKHILYLQQDL